MTNMTNDGVIFWERGLLKYSQINPYLYIIYILYINMNSKKSKLQIRSLGIWRCHLSYLSCSRRKIATLKGKNFFLTWPQKLPLIPLFSMTNTPQSIARLPSSAPRFPLFLPRFPPSECTFRSPRTQIPNTFPPIYAPLSLIMTIMTNDSVIFPTNQQFRATNHGICCDGKCTEAGC